MKRHTLGIVRYNLHAAKQYRHFSSKFYEYMAKPPAKREEPAWTRLAWGIKGTAQNKVSNSISAAACAGAAEATSESTGAAGSTYYDRLRRVHDPEQHLHILEDELCEEIACALGRTGRKCDYMFHMMELAAAECDRLEAEVQRLHHSTTPSSSSLEAAAAVESLKQAITKFNSARSAAHDARTELVIHRQSVGLIWRNQRIVEEQYPLPPARRI